MRSIRQHVLAFIQKEDLLRAGDRVGVAVSGGADSVGLLCILLELRRELGVVLSVLHLNHQLRGAESDGDEQFVRSLAMRCELEICCQSRDVGSHAAAHKLSLETAARELRYEFFRSRLQEGDCEKIATAHTVDDQAETVLLKLVRGAGTRGLAGIYPRISVERTPTNITQATAIVRPLLDTRRADLIAYLQEIGQDWREDSTNRDLRHRRNRVRHGILMHLAEELNPQVRETLGEAAEIARAEEEFWRAELGRWLPQTWHGDGPAGTLDLPRAEELPLAVRRRLIRAIGELLGVNLEFRHVEEVLRLHAEGQRAALPAGWVALRHKHELCFRQENEARALDYEYELPLPGRIEVREAAVGLETLEVRNEDPERRYEAEHLLDRSLARRGLRARNWRPGDRFWPAHSKEPKKIKELLQDRGIAGEEKKLWTVVASGEEIVWMRGFGVRRDYQAVGAEGVLIRAFPLEVSGNDR
jgi:tRNA(Ile)-lysidine synthase